MSIVWRANGTAMASPDRDPELEQVARNLRAARERAGLSQVALAEKAGVSLAHVNRLENARRDPGVKMLVRIARAVGTPASELLAGID